MSAEVYPQQRVPGTGADPAPGANNSHFDRPAGASLITYGLVRKAAVGRLTEELAAKGKSLQRANNCNTALNGWLKCFELTDESPVGPEFGAQFRSHLDKHTAALEAEGKSSSTIADRRSLLGKCRHAWEEQLRTSRAATVDGDFAESLRKLFEGADMTIAEISRRVRVNQSCLSDWSNGRSLPSHRNFPAVQRLEELFNLPHGALGSKLPRFLLGGHGPIRKGLTGYRRHMQVIRKHRFALTELPPGARQEWERLFLFYTDSAWLRLQKMKRSSKWRVREFDQRCGTAERNYNLVRNVFNYAILPKNPTTPALGGKGLARESLTLALFSDSDFIYEYMQFKRERTYLKCYNTDIQHLLRFCLSLLRPETGFVRQSPKLGAKLPAPVSPGDWDGWCDGNRAVLSATLKDMRKENEFKKTRDPFEPIRAIIVNHQHPIDALFDLADALEWDRPHAGAHPVRKAAHYQILFLIKFATLVPLRVFNFSIMTYRPDNTGNLYQRPDGSWWIRFDVRDFKNHKGAARDLPYDVPLHTSIWPYLKDFLFVHRPRLVGAGECDYVFRPISTSRLSAKKPDEPVTISFLSRNVYRVSQRYIPDCPGFSMHAFRHLSATEYVKNNPAGYAVAAAVLHDREETVRAAYSWVAPADKIMFWNQYISAQRERRERREEVDGDLEGRGDAFTEAVE